MVESKRDSELIKLEELCGDKMRTYSDESIRIDMLYSEVKSASVIFRFPKDEETGLSSYPTSAVVFELKSTTIPAKLVAMLSKKMENHIAELAKDGKPHVLSAYQFVSNIIENNNLIPCWSEFPQIKSVIDPKKGDVLKPLEKLGKLKLTLKEGDMYAICEFEIPPNYPMEMVKFTLKDHNFNPVFAEIFTTHTKGIIKRLWGGGAPGYDPKQKVNINEGKIGYKKAAGKLESEMAKISVATRAELKHDMDFLKKQKELRDGTMDKKDRKEFKLNLKHEKRYEEAKAAEVEE